jgi:CPA2 family monovalent cation:H+ antiporter-2
MHHAPLIQDLAVIMLIAGVVTVVFHRLKQPVVLGYIVAGVIIGPHTPPFPLITDQASIQTLGELGVVFLLFSLGLEFDLRRLRRVGATAVVAAVAEIALMLWLGYALGRLFGWGAMDSIFLGAILAISSTTIIVKAFEELGMKRERFAQLVFGILIVEDVLAIAIIAVLSVLAITGAVSPAEVGGTLARLGVFLIVSLVVGLLLVPRFIGWVARSKSDEMLLVATLGLCFGFSLLVVKAGYSIALGAFVIGAILAEAREHKTIERLVTPVRDVFSAIFFVTVGLLLDPAVLVQYAWPVIMITAAIVVGKVASCSLGCLVMGHDGRTSMGVGMSLAQIGEFSFIIAALGASLKVTSEFLYPVTVAVAVLATFFTPYLIRASDGVAARAREFVPLTPRRLFGAYLEWLDNMAPGEQAQIVAQTGKRTLLYVVMNFAIVAALFIAGAYLARSVLVPWPDWLSAGRVRDTVLWAAALALSLPFLVATYRKLSAFALLLAELGMRTPSAGRFCDAVRRVVAGVIPAISVVAMVVLVSMLSAGILPPLEALVVVLAGAVVAAVLLWRRLVRLHARMEIALLDTLQRKPTDSH